MKKIVHTVNCGDRYVKCVGRVPVWYRTTTRQASGEVANRLVDIQKRDSLHENEPPGRGIRISPGRFSHDEFGYVETVPVPPGLPPLMSDLLMCRGYQVAAGPRREVAEWWASLRDLSPEEILRQTALAVRLGTCTLPELA